MIKYSINEISQIVNGKIIGDEKKNVWQIQIDSRQYFSPEGQLFIALKGERYDAHKYIPDLLANKKCSCFIVEYVPSNLNYDKKDVTFIIVENSTKALQILASYHRKKFNYPVIAITGSNGKTIVKEWLFHLLSIKYNIIKSPKSYNSQIGVPLSILNMDYNYDIGIFEAGISQKGEMEKLEKIICPTIGIITNIGEAHQENFKSYEEKTEEKLKLFENCNTIFCCKDHDIIFASLKEKRKKNQSIITWSFYGDADLIIKDIKKNASNSIILGQYKEKEIKITIPFNDKASIENSIICLLLLLYINIPEPAIKEGMKSLPSIAMRLEQKKGINGCTIINDSYNSDFHSLSLAIDFLTQQQHKTKTIILSDILQTGKSNEELYQNIAKLLTQKKIDKLYGIGPNISASSEYFDVEKKFFQSTDEFVKNFKTQYFNNEAILIKGARQFEFEKISQLLEQQIHLTRLEINLSALIHNLNYYRSLLNKNTKIMVMVKAFSYGSGSYEIASLLEYNKVDYLAVAFSHEGVELRKSGISIPIVVMNAITGSFYNMFEYNLEAEIYSFEILYQYIEEAKKYQIKEAPIHIKIDTGMHRLGFMPEEVDKLCEILANNKILRVKSIFSHLAASDESIHDEYTLKQIKEFDTIANEIIKRIGYHVDKHILNSAGIERFPQYQFDMVRLGIGLYGSSPVGQNKLQVVSTLKTIITQIKKLPAKSSIGYSRKGTIDKDSIIGIIPIGYADGLKRILSNKNGRVFINGKYAPIIGNICMDMSMIDITDIEAKVGDEVEIFGNHISLDEIATKAHTITYEILTGISERVKRIYVQE